LADIGAVVGASTAVNVAMAAGQSTEANDKRGIVTSCAALPALTRASAKPEINPKALTSHSHVGPFPADKIADKSGVGRALFDGDPTKSRPDGRPSHRLRAGV
jgi:hypothetical protein